MDGWVGGFGWMDLDVWMNEKMDECMDGWVDGFGWMGGFGYKDE